MDNPIIFKVIIISIDFRFRRTFHLNFEKICYYIYVKTFQLIIFFYFLKHVLLIFFVFFLFFVRLLQTYFFCTVLHNLLFSVFFLQTDSDINFSNTPFFIFFSILDNILYQSQPRFCSLSLFPL